MLTAVLVEDSAEHRDLTRWCLEIDGNTQVIGEAIDGAAGLDVISRLHPDVAVVDLHMPKMNGVELIRELRSRGCTLRLVAYSCDDQALSAALAAGADASVPKSRDFGQLLVAISG